MEGTGLLCGEMKSVIGSDVRKRVCYVGRRGPW